MFEEDSFKGVVVIHVQGIRDITIPMIILLLLLDTPAVEIIMYYDVLYIRKRR